MAKNLKTPETLPWIPPGQTKEETFNKFAHKKGSIASRINQEVAAKKSSISNLSKKSVSLNRSGSSSNILSLSDSGRGSQLTTSDRNELKDKIVEIFEEDENEYDSNGENRFNDSGRSSSGSDSSPRLRKRDQYKTSFHSDSDNDSLKENKSQPKNHLRNKVADFITNDGKFRWMKDVRTPLDVRALTPNTAEMRGYQAMRRELDQEERRPGSLESRKSIRYHDTEDPRHRSYPTDLNQSFTTYSVSPRYKLSDPNQRPGDVTEAWLVFPEGRVPQNGSHVGDYPSPRSKLSIGSQPLPVNGRLSVRDYPSPRRIPGEYPRIGEKGVGRAIPVNLASSVGSMLKNSFANINSVRETPVETFMTEEDTDRILRQEKSKSRCPTWVWGFLICLAVFLLIAIIIGTVTGVMTAAEANSANLMLSNQPGPGDNSPCKDYVALTEKWRRIIGKGPSQTGQPYSCDNPFKEGWYRFDGEAGSRLADNTNPPSWEDCGTSRVGWLSGSHPEISDGTVNRTLCVTAFNGNCEVKMPNGQVRGCPDPRGGVFFVYYLVQPRISCNWGYCAVGEPPS